MRSFLAVLLICCIGGPCPAVAQVASAPVVAQNAPAQAVPGAPIFTLHTGTQMVVTDVSVTDKQGKPVVGLDRSAFRIFDNGRPQPVALFEAHAGALNLDPSIASASPMYTNLYLLHPPAASTVLFIDITRLSLPEQMYLAEELTQFVEALPTGEFLAVYTRSGLRVRLLQDFTSDHDLLRTAVAKAVPRFAETDAYFANDLGALIELQQKLKGLPGRKNVLWFSGVRTRLCRQIPPPA